MYTKLASYLFLVLLLFVACSHKNARLPVGGQVPDTTWVVSIPESPTISDSEEISLEAAWAKNPKYCWVKSEYINVRSEPNKDAEVLEYLPRGSKFKLFENIVGHSGVDGQDGTDGESSSKWLKVGLADKSHIVGYVYAPLVSLEKPIDPLEDFRVKLTHVIIPGESISSLISSVARGDDDRSLFVYVTDDWKNILNAYTIFPVSHPDRSSMQTECVSRLENISNDLFQLWNQCLTKNGYGPANNIRFIDESGVAVGEIVRRAGNDLRVEIKQ